MIPPRQRLLRTFTLPQGQDKRCNWEYIFYFSNYNLYTLKIITINDHRDFLNLLKQNNIYTNIYIYYDKVASLCYMYLG